MRWVSNNLVFIFSKFPGDDDAVVQELPFDNLCFWALLSLSDSGVPHLTLLPAGGLRYGVTWGGDHSMKVRGYRLGYEKEIDLWFQGLFFTQESARVIWRPENPTLWFLSHPPPQHRHTQSFPLAPPNHSLQEESQAVEGAPLGSELTHPHAVSRITLPSFPHRCFIHPPLWSEIPSKAFTSNFSKSQ